MKTDYWLRTATTYLQSKSIATARLDCLVLLEDTTLKERGWLLAHPEYELTDAAVKHLKNLLNRRARHEPLAYIRGRVEFYGRVFAISRDVLVPRPESEAMIDLLKDLDVFKAAKPAESSQNDPFSVAAIAARKAAENSQKRLKIGDIGAGSGALGITAALELPNCQVELVELDEKARKTAKMNVDKFTLQIPVIASDLLTQTSQDYDILLCNLPYVPDDYPINAAARHEPSIALFAGPDGLDLYRKLFSQVQNCQKRPLYFLTESLTEQHGVLADIAASFGYSLVKTEGLVQLFTPSPTPAPVGHS